MTEQKTTTNQVRSPDEGLFEIIRRHDHAWKRMDDLVAIGGDDATDTPEYQAASWETVDLEYRVTAYPVQTEDGNAAKLAFMRKYDLVGSLDAETLIEVISELDAERVAARRDKTGEPAEHIASAR